MKNDTMVLLVIVLLAVSIFNLSLNVDNISFKNLIKYASENNIGRSSSFISGFTTREERGGGRVEKGGLINLARDKNPNFDELSGRDKRVALKKAWNAVNKIRRPAESVGERAAEPQKIAELPKVDPNDLNSVIWGGGKVGDYLQNNLKDLPKPEEVAGELKDKKPDDLKSPKLTVNKFCNIKLDIYIYIGSGRMWGPSSWGPDTQSPYAKVEEKDVAQWLFECDDQLCKDDQAPCKQNPCLDKKGEICGTACCNEAYDGTGSAGKLCSVEPDYKYEGNDGETTPNPEESAKTQASSQEKPCCQIVNDVLKEDIKRVNEKDTGKIYPYRSLSDSLIHNGECFDAYELCKNECNSAKIKLAGELNDGKKNQNFEDTTAVKNYFEEQRRTYENDVNRECKKYVENCRKSCLEVNQKCREGDRSCQRLAKEKVQEYYTALPDDEKSTKSVPNSEVKSCYDTRKGMNKHVMTSDQVRQLSDWQKYDWINSMHNRISPGFMGYIDGNKLKGEDYIPYSENHLIGWRPLSADVMADRIINGGKDNLLTPTALNAEGIDWDAKDQSFSNSETYAELSNRRDVTDFWNSDDALRDYYGFAKEHQKALAKAMEIHASKEAAAKETAAGGAEGVAGRMGPEQRGGVALGTQLSCFLAGTKITMGDGTQKIIEEVSAGEKVLSYDEKSGKNIVSKVTQKFVHDNVYKYLVINNLIKVTPEHVMFVNGKWAGAGDVKVGDKLQDINGNDIPVTSVEIMNLKEPITVYNIEVEGTHTFYAEGLVHNAIKTGREGESMTIGDGEGEGEAAPQPETPPPVTFNNEFVLKSPYSQPEKIQNWKLGEEGDWKYITLLQGYDNMIDNKNNEYYDTGGDPITYVKYRRNDKGVVQIQLSDDDTWPNPDDVSPWVALDNWNKYGHNAPELKVARGEVQLAKPESK